MKIKCPKCNNEMTYLFSTTLTDKQTCPKCHNELDLKDCTLLVFFRYAFIVLFAILVYMYTDEYLANVIPSQWLRIPAMIVIAAIPILIVLHLVSPVMYTRVYVEKGKSRKNTLKLKR